MFTVRSVVASTIDWKPERFVDARVCCSVTAFAGDPQRGLGECHTNVLVVVRVSDLKRDDAGNILYLHQHSTQIILT